MGGLLSPFPPNVGMACVDGKTQYRHNNQDTISCKLWMGCNWSRFLAVVSLWVFVCLNHPVNPVSNSIFLYNEMYLQLWLDWINILNCWLGMKKSYIWKFYITPVHEKLQSHAVVAEKYLTGCDAHLPFWRSFADFAGVASRQDVEYCSLS